MARAALQVNGSPAISVVVPTHNRAGAVVRAVHSVLGQSFSDFEVVVVDDGSTDETASAVDALDDARVRYLSQENSGPSVARNTGAAAARAGIITFLDSDDLAMPGWLAAHVEAFADPSVRLTRSGYVDLDARGAVRSVVFARDPGDAGHTQGTFIPGTFAIRKDLFDTVGGYEPALRFGENTELAVRVLSSWRSERWRAVVIPRLLIRRQWSDRAAKYDDLKATTARFEVEHHAEFLRTHGESWSVRQSIIGVADARAGDLRSARRAFLSAWRATPLRPRVAARAVVSCVPLLARRAWPQASSEASAAGAAPAAEVGPAQAMPTPDAAVSAAQAMPTPAAAVAVPGCDLVVAPGRPGDHGVVGAVGDSGPLPLVGDFCDIRADVAWMLGGRRPDLNMLATTEIALRATAAEYTVCVSGEQSRPPAPSRSPSPASAPSRSPSQSRSPDAVRSPLREAFAAGREEVRVARDYAALGARPAPLPRRPTTPTAARILGRTRERLPHTLFGRIWSPGLR